MIKKYHLADIFTLLEIILACTLIGVTFLHVSANYVIWIFVAGELCDAIDGPCARRFPYPDDSKYRWWRQPRTVQAIEHVSDILLISALAFYLMTQGGIICYITTIGSFIVFAYCMLTEFWLQTTDTNQKSRLRAIRCRRYVYLTGIAIGIAELIFCTTWHLYIKIGSCIIGLIIGVMLIIAKWNRFTETDETFSEFLHRKLNHR